MDYPPFFLLTEFTYLVLREACPPKNVLFFQFFFRPPSKKIQKKSSQNIKIPAYLKFPTPK